jgi:hypothetical protein
MCDYSLHAQATRDAVQGESLITSRFPNTDTKGFASPKDCHTAVCLKPGTEIVFEHDPMRSSFWRFLFGRKRNIGNCFATFTQVNKNAVGTHHDALVFVDGTRVLLTNLVPGQYARVVQLPKEVAHGATQEESRSYAERRREGVGGDRHGQEEHSRSL